MVRWSNTSASASSAARSCSGRSFTHASSSATPVLTRSAPVGPTARSSASTSPSAPPSTGPTRRIDTCTISRSPGRTPSRRRSSTIDATPRRRCTSHGSILACRGLPRAAPRTRVAWRPWPSTSPMRPSRPRCSSVRCTRRWWSTCGPVVRSVQDARPDPRAGDRRDGRQGRARQGQRRREPGGQPGVPGAVDPGGVRPVRRARSSTGSSVPTPRTSSQQFVQSLLPSDDEQELQRLIDAGDEASLRQALVLEPGNEDAIVAARASSSSSRATPTRRWRCSPACPSATGPADRRGSTARHCGRHPRRRLRHAARSPARPGQGRRRGAPAVRRHPRAHGSGRPAHRASTAAS